jgi:hypothetical protein
MTKRRGRGTGKSDKLSDLKAGFNQLSSPTTAAITWLMGRAAFPFHKPLKYGPKDGNKS